MSFDILGEPFSLRNAVAPGWQIGESAYKTPFPEHTYPVQVLVRRRERLVGDPDRGSLSEALLQFGEHLSGGFLR